MFNTGTVRKPVNNASLSPSPLSFLTNLGAVEAINKEYEKRGIDPSSLTKIIDKYYPTHRKEVHEIEKQMFECLNNDKESYRGILRKWYELIIKEIDLYEGFLE